MSNNECTSVVGLHKLSTGVIYAYPVTDVSMKESRLYPINGTTRRLSASAVVLGRSYRLKHLTGTRYVIKPELAKPLPSPHTRLIKVLGVILIAGGILLIGKHKRLFGLATGLSGLFISATSDLKHR